MVTAVNDLAVNPGDPWYYRQGWKAVVEDHLELLRSGAGSEPKVVTDTDRYRYRADFYAYLRDACNIQERHYYYVVLRMNGMYSPLEFGDEHLAILIPSKPVIEKIMTLYRTSKGST
jgi:hypothetical protein